MGIPVHAQREVALGAAVEIAVDEIDSGQAGRQFDRPHGALLQVELAVRLRAAEGAAAVRPGLARKEITAHDVVGGEGGMVRPRDVRRGGHVFALHGNPTVHQGAFQADLVDLARVPSNVDEPHALRPALGASAESESLFLLQVIGQTDVRQPGLAGLVGRRRQPQGEIGVGAVGEAVDRSVVVGARHGEGPVDAFVKHAVLEENADLPAGYEGVGEGSFLQGNEAAAGQLLQAEGRLELADVEVAETRQLDEPQVHVRPADAAAGEIIFGLETDVRVQRAADVDAAAAEENAVQRFVQVAVVVLEVGVLNLVARADEVPVVLDAAADANLDVLVQGAEAQPVAPQRLHVLRLVHPGGFFQALDPLLQAHLGLRHRARAQDDHQRQSQHQRAPSHSASHANLLLP